MNPNESDAPVTPIVRRLALRPGGAFALAALALLAPAWISSLPAQEILVDLEVNESTDGLFQGAFAESIGDLDGVGLTGPGDLAHYTLTVAVLCEPAPELCGSAESFGVSVILSEPVTPLQLRNGLERTGDPILDEWEATPEARAFLQRYQRIHSVWTTSWDASTVRDDVRRLVQGVDARCFQQRRVLETRREALLSRGDTTAARRLPAELDATGRSLC